MGSFGDGVDALLDTYTRCLALLRQLTTQGSEASQEQIRLGGSIRSSRSRVRKYYSSKVSESGSSFEKGDATARSSLRRLVRRLRAFVDGVTRVFDKHDQYSIDYGSLISLSQGSGLEAIRTMTDLSERVNMRSSIPQNTVKSPDYSKATGGRTRGRPKTSRSSSRATTTSERRPTLHKMPSSAHIAAQEPTSRGSSKTQPYTKGSRHTLSRQSLRNSADSLGRRRSTLTTSSDSTKLGEVQPGERRKQARATYPMWTNPREPVKLKKGRLFGLFAR